MGRRWAISDKKGTDGSYAASDRGRRTCLDGQKQREMRPRSCSWRVVVRRATNFALCAGLVGASFRTGPFWFVPNSSRRKMAGKPLATRGRRAKQPTSRFRHRSSALLRLGIMTDAEACPLRRDARTGQPASNAIGRNAHVILAMQEPVKAQNWNARLMQASLSPFFAQTELR